jgi:hypothetical protein
MMKEQIWGELVFIFYSFTRFKRLLPRSKFYEIEIAHDFCEKNQFLIFSKIGNACANAHHCRVHLKSAELWRKSAKLARLQPFAQVVNNIPHDHVIRLQKAGLKK